MNVELQELSEAVESLNDRFYHQTEDTRVPFEFRSTGEEQCVMFFGHSIWDSESDIRQYADDGERDVAEPLLRCLERAAQDLVNTLAKVNFIPNLVPAKLINSTGE